MSADTPRAAVREIEPTAKLSSAAAAANAAFSLGTPRDRVAAFQSASREFARSYGAIVAAQLSAPLKLQILLAGAAALMWSNADGDKPTIEQFIEFLTEFPPDAQRELADSLRHYMMSLGSTEGLDTTDLKPN